MKKYFIMIFSIIMFIPFIVNAETCDNNISITSISMKEKSNGVKELSPATVEGKNINLNLSLSNVGNNIVYRLVVDNKSKDDYTIDKNSFNLNTDYINYSIDSENNSKVVKSNSKKVMFLRIEYKNEVPDDAFDSGVYNDVKTMSVQLSSRNIKDILNNPKTGVSLFILIILILVVSGISYVVLKKKKNYKLIALLLMVTVIPTSAFALCTFSFDINSKIAIEQKPFTGTLYRKNSNEAGVGDSIRSVSKYLIVNKHSDNVLDYQFNSKEECNQKIRDLDIANNMLVCENRRVGGVGDYYLSPDKLNSNYYIKSEVKDNIITKTEVCFITDKEVCLSSGYENFDDSYHKLVDESSWFENHNGSCRLSTTDWSECSGGSYARIYAGFMTSSVSVRGMDYYECSPYSCNKAPDE